jgi:hypothetical protein
MVLINAIRLLALFMVALLPTCCHFMFGKNIITQVSADGGGCYRPGHEGEI